MDLKRQKTNVLGVDVDDISSKSAVDTIVKWAGSKKTGKYVVTINSEFVMLARRNRDFLKILNAADLAVADGQWVVWAKLILGGKEHERVTGVDLVEKLCEKCAKKPITVGFLGGFGDVAKMAAKRQTLLNPGLKVAFAGAGDDAIGQDLKLRYDILGKKRVDILFVAYGMGRQEFWIARNKNRYSLSSNRHNVGVFIGVGGALDYLSTVKKRAPRWLRGVGFEWLWRLFWQPWRAKRMIRVPVFWLLVFRQLLRQKFKTSGEL